LQKCIKVHNKYLKYLSNIEASIDNVELSVFNRKLIKALVEYNCNH